MIARCWFLIWALGLLFSPALAQAQGAELAGVRDASAALEPKADAHECRSDRWNSKRSSAAIAGTIQATVPDVWSGRLGAIQLEGRIFSSRLDNGLQQAQQEVEASEEQARDAGSQNDGGRGDLQLAHQPGVLSKEEGIPWELLIAAWALWGAALLSRGARRRLVRPTDSGNECRRT